MGLDHPLYRLLASLTWFTHMLDVQLFGMKAGWHHLMNVFFHIANALLLFLILHRMTKALWQSAFVAALFALHPLHVESVAWTAERKDVLSTLFWMLSLGTYTYYVERPGYRKYLFVLGFFALALMSKPMVVTFPFVLLLLDYWPLGRLQPAQQDRSGAHNAVSPEKLARKQRRAANASAKNAVPLKEQAVQPVQWSLIQPLLREKAPLFFLSIISSVITFINQEEGTSLHALPADARMANALVSYGKYLVKTIWPQDLAVFYPHPETLPFWQVLGAALLLSTVTFLVVWKTKRYPYLGVGWLWYLGTLVPVIGLVQSGSQAMGDRYSYVSLIGIFIMVAWGVPDSLKKWNRRKTALGILSGAVVLTCIVLTWLQLRLWQNSETLFRHALKVTVDNSVANNNLGAALLDQGKIADAMTHFQAALRIDPRNARAWNNLGTVYEKSGQTAKAIEAFQQALKLRPKDAEFWNNIGLVYGKSGQTAKAVEAIQQALRIDPAYDEAWNNLGNAYGAIGETVEAIEAFQEALRINPKHANAWNNLGVAYADSGRSVEAIAAFRQSLRVSPEQASVWNNLAVAYRKQGQTAEAIEAYRQALAIKPDYAKAWFGLGVVYGESGQTERVREVYRRLRAMDPTLAAEFSRMTPLPEK